MFACFSTLSLQRLCAVLVLPVEDNALNQIVVKGYLSKFHVAVDIAEDRFLTAEPGYYDAILMDIQMLNLDGYEATKTIRESDHPKANTIQIIAQTADAFHEDIDKVLAAGMNAHVAKPIKPKLPGKALYNAYSQSVEPKRQAYL